MKQAQTQELDVVGTDILCETALWVMEYMQYPNPLDEHMGIVTGSFLRTINIDESMGTLYRTEKLPLALQCLKFQSVFEFLSQGLLWEIHRVLDAPDCFISPDFYSGMMHTVSSSPLIDEAHVFRNKAFRKSVTSMVSSPGTLSSPIESVEIQVDTETLDKKPQHTVLLARIAYEGMKGQDVYIAYGNKDFATSCLLIGGTLDSNVHSYIATEIYKLL